MTSDEWSAARTLRALLEAHRALNGSCDRELRLLDAIEAEARALDRAHPQCPVGCGCRLWTEDADVHDCACDGPCCWLDWDQFLTDVLDHPDEYRARLAAQGEQQ